MTKRKLFKKGELVRWSRDVRALGVVTKDQLNLKSPSFVYWQDVGRIIETDSTGVRRLDEPFIREGE